jgi:hypothetical protein
MATKKQKRTAALARREAFLAEEKARGLEAQSVSRHNHDMSRQAEAAAAKELEEHRAEIDHARKYGTPAEKMGQFVKALAAKPKPVTSYYSEVQGRPVNRATFLAERKQEQDDFDRARAFAEARAINQEEGLPYDIANWSRPMDDNGIYHVDGS